MKRIEIIGVDTSSLPKISGEESRQYLLEIKNGNEEKKNEFINANIRLVLSIVQRFSNGRGEADDLFQVGCVGLLKALNNFDVPQNVRFSTYAVPMIIGEIRRFQRESTGIKVSRSQRDVAYRVFVADALVFHTGDGRRAYEKVPVAIADTDLDGCKLIYNADALKGVI